MSSTLSTALGILATQAKEAIDRAPAKYAKDIKNIEAFVKAIGDKAKTVNVVEAEQMAQDLDPIFKAFVNGLVSIGKPSISWLWGGFDPFRSMRFEADFYASKWNLNWSR